jgi:hypothetical protein
MPNITLLQLKTVSYSDAADLDRLIITHKDELSKKIETLDDPKTPAAFNAIAYNLIFLMRERQKFKRQKAKLLVLDGGKKD